MYWTTYQYDVLGRLTQENAPISESQGSGALTTYQYLGHELSVTNPKNHAVGQIRQVLDALSGSVSYTYWPFGELYQVTDAESKLTTITYDARASSTRWPTRIWGLGNTSTRSSENSRRRPVR